MENIHKEMITRNYLNFLDDNERGNYYFPEKNIQIRPGAILRFLKTIEIGKNNWIGERAYLDGSGTLVIGESNQIGLDVKIFTHTSHKQAIKGETMITDRNIIRKPVKIGNNNFIAGPTVIIAGITIGNNNIIRPFTLVDIDISDNQVVGGNGSLKNMLSIENRLKKLEE